MPLRLPQRLEQSTYGSVVLSIIRFLGISECNTSINLVYIADHDHIYIDSAILSLYT